MPKVHCLQTTCEYWKKDGAGNDGLCGRGEIELDDDSMCFTYGAHSDISPEYQETFWKRMKRWEDKHECRKEARGKRYNLIRLVWFTDNDDRWGTDEIWFTEQKSGLRCQGKDINEEHAEMIKKKINSVPPVESLPEASIDEL